ncbi:MAG: BlaI/MecI/CopY family transcriptional regulator [Planctomycetota bacterium]
MLTAPEAEVMNVVWGAGETTIADIVDHIPRELAYTTVMTTVRILEEKGFVKKRGKQGRAFLYAAAVDKATATSSMTHEVASRLFAGSVKQLMLSLLGDSTVDADDLAEIRQVIEQLEAKS